MAKGDAIGNLASVNAAATLTIQPPSGKEWIVHNIYFEAEVEVYLVRGANELLFADAAAKGSLSAYFFHLTNAQYIKVKNTNAAAKLVGYDGVESKE
ncbi:MAG: hypothetical protein U9N01_04555 [Euryarchaeota archaeon]|nr:hypothetical protein [Euryarchaeota archaeon]